MAVGSASTGISAAMVAGVTSDADWLVVAPVVAPIVFGALLLMFRQETRSHAAIALAGLGAVIAANAGLLHHVLAEGPVVMTMGRWLPPFGISFDADALGASFALVASAVAFVCGFLAARTISAAERRYGFYPFLMLMMAGVNGAFLTGDIFNLYVWFEVFLISSFGLLILGSQREQIDGATKYAILNLVATTLFLIATGLLYGTFGTLNMADLARKAHAIEGGSPLTTLAVLYLLAFGMKAAAFPVNFWLPASYHTPRIVIAALFGGLLTKVGIYALLRSLVMLFPVERAVLSGVIGWVAAATMILGIMGALAQSDTRRIFGFVVISSVGVMLAGISVGGPDGISGTILYAMHSMLVMTALYILAGLMREIGGSFSLHELSGLYRASPLLAAVALVLVLAVAGLPPGSGLWPKVILVKAALDRGAWWLALAILASGLLTALALGRVFTLAFWREQDDGRVNRQTIALPATGFAALATLAIPIVVIGVYPEPLIRLAMAAASGLIDASGYIGAVFPGGAL
jgi:multicomponent Na+:H+ antiporter subunit D